MLTETVSGSFHWRDIPIGAVCRGLIRICADNPNWSGTKSERRPHPRTTRCHSQNDRADQVLLEGRQSVRDLREEGTSGGDLSQALARCGQELAQDHAPVFTLAVVGTPQALGSVVFSEVYRIPREGLINAFTHSQASKIEVEFTYYKGRLTLRVRDDGKGIDAQTVSAGRKGHWGLSGMRERAQKVGAQLSLWSHPGAGTEIELTIPAKVAYPRKSEQSLWRRIRRPAGNPEEV